ncbi:LLM class flavin-dependent oxidoreductase [Bradyrhizobium sp. Pha-3]|uniref:LLM class flavin-dependent oxidoreductase n=1 Tax=Bradyrhizobium sp. Pha-3 TaxID=208375 RepID=UPI0035D50944
MSEKSVDSNARLSPLDIVKRQPLMLGLFLPIQSGAWSPSLAPRETSWTFEYNARCTVMAENLGFDLVFGLAQWMGKGGYGGEMKFREMATDPLLITAGLAALTKRILLVSTVHILYGWHPLHLAKFGATISEMSRGRWGLNMVTGYKKSEFEMFGLDSIEHDDRYVMADEFVTMMKRLWSEDENMTMEGHFWKMKDAFIAPKPVGGKCVLVNASSSGAGLAYAVKHSDLIFVTSPAGANLDRACAALPAHTAKIREAAKAQNRDVRILINPHVICRETEEEAWAQYQAILKHQDPVAAEKFYKTFTGGDQTSWKAATREEWTIGGNVHIVGTPAQVVDGFRRLKEAGCDGVQINFFDFIPDLKFFGDRVLPLMQEVGLRLPSTFTAAA